MLNTVEDIRYELKEILEMNRAPKCIKTFWVMKHIWERHNSDINLEDSDIFISTTLLKKMNIGTNIYRKYFSKFVCWDNEEDYSMKYGRCRTIQNWTSAFIDLMNKTKSFDVPKEIAKEYCSSITPTSVAGKEKLLSIWSSMNKPQDNFSDFYTSTHSSPFRVYHPLQNLKRAERNEKFKGCWDIDLVSAHTSIAYFELGLKETNLPFAWMLNPECKDLFIDTLMTEFSCSKEKAKELRCILTTPFKHPYGVKWFDDLHAEISRRTKEQFKRVEWKNKSINIDTHHKYFTWIEQQIINQLSADNETLLNIHDGIITKNKPTSNTIIFNNNTYKLKIEEMGEA